MSYYVFEELSIELVGKWNVDAIRLMNLFLKMAESLCGADGCFGDGFPETEEPDCIEWEWNGNHGMTDFFKELTYGNAYPREFEMAGHKTMPPEQWTALMQTMKKNKLRFEVFSYIDGEGGKWCETNEYYGDGEKLCYEETESWDIEPEWSDYNDDEIMPIVEYFSNFVSTPEESEIEAFIVANLLAPNSDSGLLFDFESLSEDEVVAELSGLMSLNTIKQFQKKLSPDTESWEKFQKHIRPFLT